MQQFVESDDNRQSGTEHTARERGRYPHPLVRDQPDNGQIFFQTSGSLQRSITDTEKIKSRWYEMIAPSFIPGATDKHPGPEALRAWNQDFPGIASRTSRGK